MKKNFSLSSRNGRWGKNCGEQKRKKGHERNFNAMYLHSIRMPFLWGSVFFCCNLLFACNFFVRLVGNAYVLRDDYVRCTFIVATQPKEVQHDEHFEHPSARILGGLSRCRGGNCSSNGKIGGGGGIDCKPGINLHENKASRAHTQNQREKISCLGSGQ